MELKCWSYSAFVFLIPLIKDDVLSEIRKMQQRDSGDEDAEDEDDDTRSGRRSSLGMLNWHERATAMERFTTRTYH